MKLIFKQTYTFPVSVASAVVAYLDCEHYIHLHQNCEKKYKIINLTEDKCISEILYKSGLFYWKQISTTEYSNVAEIKQYDISIKGFGPSILANFLNVRTILKYYSNDKDQEVEDIKNNFKLVKLNRNNKITLCEIIYDIDIPFYLYPFKNFLKKKLIKMKRTKDLEDLYMIEKRIKLFGSDIPYNYKSSYWSPYFKKSYFLLFKDKFINNFFQLTNNENKSSINES